MPTTKNKSLLPSTHRYLLCSLVLMLLVAFTVVLTSREVTEIDKQPKQIKFSHQLHKESGAACADCHSEAAASVKASDNLLAKMEVCKSCHEDQVSKNCTYCHLSADSTTYRATPNPVRELTFSHQKHVEEQKTVCETCHTVLDKENAGTGELVPAMATCASCHNGAQAANACETCHTNAAALRPADHNRTNYMREHKFSARLNDAKCGACHTQETCIDCHNGSELMKVDVPGKDLMSLRSPRLMAIDRGQGMRLTKIHDLNFKFTHGISAKGKAMECQTCHSAEQFCSECHKAGGNVNQGEFKPASHSVAGFTTLGVGSGGGEHARLAKRDIESCAACHSIEGADPICLTCHTDVDGVKGNDPKTHDRGFMSDTHGNWHTDPGANCYTCHTDVNARPGGVKGQKFCGYCHR
jgi:hypothetical protein